MKTRAFILSDSQTFSSYVEDSQSLPLNADAFDGLAIAFLVVAMSSVSTISAIKTSEAHMRGSMKGNTIKCQPFLSTFVPNKMCDIITSGG